MDYLDFELEIARGNKREYPVVVVRSPAGEARDVMHFPFGDLELENKLQALQIVLLRSGGQLRQALSPAQQTVLDFGRALFDALLTGDVRVRYDVSLERAKSQGKGLRLKLCVNTPEIAALPWEFLYDSRRADYVCLSRDTPIVRYLELPQPIQPLIVAPPLRVLGMIANPCDLGSLNVDLEKQRVEDALCDLQAAGLVRVTWLEGQTWRALQRAMRCGEYHVFHFIGHGDFDAGTDEGMVVLCGEDGKARHMSATQLGRLLTNHRVLRLALLNACEGARGSVRDLFSSTASILVRYGLPAVLAMQYPITDRAAIEFSRTFYESLVDGLPVDAAVVESRVAISMAVNNTLEWGTPVLFMRSPDGVIFRVHKVEKSEVREQGEESQLLKSVGSAGDELIGSQVGYQKSATAMLEGLPEALYQCLRTALLLTGVFDSDRGLRAIFLDRRLNLWRDQLPQAASPAERVRLVVDWLYTRGTASGENALVLLLQVLRDLTDMEDALYGQLNALVTELKVCLFSREILSGPESSEHESLQDDADELSPKPTICTHRQPLLSHPQFNIAQQPFEPELILILAGEFLMGDDLKIVYLPDYTITRTPVTNAHYLVFVQAVGYNPPNYWVHGAPPQLGLDHPVVGVSWQDAMAYCEWLSSAAGRCYRLPTEEEWEKAARGTDGRKYPWGDYWQDEVCNTYESRVGGTTPVGQYSPQGDSVYGCVDMAGNVWEWTNSPPDGVASERIMRGGAWRSGYTTVRCTFRLSLPYDMSYDNLGFRCVCTYEGAS